MKIFDYGTKGVNSKVNTAWITFNKLVDGIVERDANGILKDVVNGYLFTCFIPFSKKVRTFTCPQTFTQITKMSMLRVGVKITLPQQLIYGNRKFNIWKSIIIYNCE